ncbi:MAG: ATP-binding protein [Sporomusaceae bacterium]|nr:ATP-binding protein [Sporomusaceae bacterium]
MLLEFKTKNYKSFQEELVFSMMPAPKQKELEYSILKQKIGSKTYKALCSAVVYGPNASGKSNLIGAMETLGKIMSCGHIRNTEEKSPNSAAYSLELIPNCDNDESVPVEFSIKFIHSDLVFEYSISMLLGKFAENDFTRKINAEKLLVNEKLIFSRDDNNLFLGDLRVIKKYMANNSEKDNDIAAKLAKNNLNDTELFLANGFKNIFSSQLVIIINDWLNNKFSIIYRADLLGAAPLAKNTNHGKLSLYISEPLTSAAAYFGVKNNKLGFLFDDNGKSSFISIINDRFSAEDEYIFIPAKVFESYGTIRLTNMLPSIMRTIIDGGTLVVDELDASIHPMAIMSIINIFHDNDLNLKNAQLIFNTHNPIFLNSNLFRRDEIKFVDRDDETHFSTHYSLSDFKTAGNTGVRRNGYYLKNYFVNRYGAIKDIDFTSFFEDILKNEKEKVSLNGSLERK